MQEGKESHYPLVASMLLVIDSPSLYYSKSIPSFGVLMSLHLLYSSNHPVSSHVLHGSIYICLYSFILFFVLTWHPTVYFPYETNAARSPVKGLLPTVHRYPTALIYLTTPAWERRIKS